MKKIKRIQFKKYKILKISGRYFINMSNENVFVVIDGIKYYNIKRKDLRFMGMKFPEKEVLPITEAELEKIENMKVEYEKFVNRFVNQMFELGFNI